MDRGRNDSRKSSPASTLCWRTGQGAPASCGNPRADSYYNPRRNEPGAAGPAANICPMSMRTVAAAVLMLFSAALARAENEAPEAPQAAPAGISQDQAKSLVLAYLKEHGVALESSDFDLETEPAEPEIPDFYLFSAYYNTRTSLKIIGAYAVNRRTAAVWQRLNCEELKSETLDKLKDKLPTTTLGIDRPGTVTCF
jgi:hypothetical protein